MRIVSSANQILGEALQKLPGVTSTLKRLSEHIDLSTIRIVHLLNNFLVLDLIENGDFREEDLHMLDLQCDTYLKKMVAKFDFHVRSVRELIYISLYF